MVAPFNWTPEIEDEIFGRMITEEGFSIKQWAESLQARVM